MTVPPAPTYSLAGPGNGLILLVTRDAAFLDPSDVITIQKPSGLASQEWYLACIDDFPGFYKAEWVTESQMNLTVGDDRPNDTQTFFVDPQTGVLFGPPAYAPQRGSLPPTGRCPATALKPGLT